MTDQGALQHDAVFIINGSAGLAAHLFDGGGSDGKIVRCRGTQPSGTGGKMLQVREIYVDNAFEAVQGINGFITGGIPYQGQWRTPELQRLQDPGDKRCARDEGKGMNTQVCQALQGVGQFPRGERTAFVPVGNVSVLAVNTAQGTTGEKDGTGSATSGNRRFFPQMRGDTGDEHLLTEAAEARLDGTVSTALTRTEFTTIHN